MKFFMGMYDKKLKVFRHHYRLGLPMKFQKGNSLVMRIETEKDTAYLSLEPSSSGNVQMLYSGKHVSLPRTMMEKSGIGTDIMILGCGTRFEVWDRRKWEEYDRKNREQYIAELDTP